MDDMRFGYEAEGTEVTQADPCQDYVAQLPTGGFHDGGVTKPEYRRTVLIHVRKYGSDDRYTQTNSDCEKCGYDRCVTSVWRTTIYSSCISEI